MNTLRLLLTGTLIASLLDPLAANAWHMRGGGGGRSFVMPHGGNFNGAPPGPAPHPMPGPQPHPGPGPSPHPGPGPQPGPHPGPPPGPHPGPQPGPYPGPGPHPGPPPPPPPPPHGDDWYHPWAAAAVVAGTTAAVIAIGTRVTVIPADCVSVVANGVAYQHCGPTWYQPQYVGSSVQFVVVHSPW